MQGDLAKNAARFIAFMALLAVTFELLFTIAFSILASSIHQTPSAPSPLLMAIEYAISASLFAAIFLFALSALIVVVRYIGAALGRINLDKNDVYFIVALILSIATFLIGHYWR